MFVEQKEIPNQFDYLARNKRIIAEVGNSLRLKKGVGVGRGLGPPFLHFYSAGVIKSSELGVELHVGVKIPLKPGSDYVRVRLVRELAIMAVIDREKPQLRQELPAFYGLLEDQNGLAIGMLTEDFSQGGKFQVHGRARPLEVPVEILDLFVEGSVDQELLEGAGFVVLEEVVTPDGDSETKRHKKLGDFWPFVRSTYWGEHRKRFPEEAIEKELDKHTLKINYDLA